MQTKLAKLLFLIVVLSISVQTSRVAAETEIHILNVTPTIGLGTENFYPERGEEMGVNVTLVNPNASNVTINLHITVFDCESIPVGYVSLNDCSTTSGISILHAELKIATFAKVGIANIQVEVEYDHIPYASSTQQVYIQTEGTKVNSDQNGTAVDLDGDVGSSDNTPFIENIENPWMEIGNPSKGNNNPTSLSDSTHSTVAHTNDTASVAASNLTAIAADTTSPNISNLSLENKTFRSTDIQLSFSVNETTSWLAYSLDNHENVTINGNTTLTGLAYGSHTLSVFANDTAGNMGRTMMISFQIIQPSPSLSPSQSATQAQPASENAHHNVFPAEPVYAVAAVTVVIAMGTGIAMLLRKKKKSNLIAQ